MRAKTYKINLFLSILFCVAISVSVTIPHSAFGESGENAQTGKAYELVTPLFGRMLANYVFENEKDLIVLGVNKTHVTLVVWADDDGSCAYDFLSYVQARAKSSAAWKKFQSRLRILTLSADPKKVELSREKGKVFLNFSAEQASLEDLFSKAKAASAEVVIAVGSEAQLDPLAKRSEVTLLTRMSAWELEFVKDHTGRQILNLDQPELHELMVTRLVERGMNPVAARPRVPEQVEAFRSDKATKICFFRLTSG